MLNIKKSKNGAIIQKLMPYCLLLMTYHSVGVKGDNPELIKGSIDRVLRGRLLPAIENVQPLDF